MRDFRDAEALELIARAFGYENWNILSAKIEATAPRAAYEHLISQHEVRKPIAGPTAFICDGCVDVAPTLSSRTMTWKLFRLMRASEENGATAYPPLLELARGMPTEKLAH